MSLKNAPLKKVPIQKDKKRRVGHWEKWLNGKKSGPIYQKYVFTCKKNVLVRKTQNR